MGFITEAKERMTALEALGGLDVEPVELSASLGALDDEAVLAVYTHAVAVKRQMEKVTIVAAGIMAQRSARDRGPTGMAAVRGQRSATDLVQSITGGTRADAEREVRLGAAIVDAAAADAGVDTAAPDASAGVPLAQPVAPSWDACLRSALLSERVTAAQHDAIFRGLGTPPLREGETEPSEVAVEAWALAAEQLVGEAPSFTVEDLRRHARTVRDALDPRGAAERFTRRFEQRSFRMWTDDEGTTRAHIAFDDEMAAWVRTVIDAALRPRRGGPRFVDADEKAAAEGLVADRRTNEQLTYDLVMDVFRAGALAEAKDVFGTRQAGVRMVVVKDTVGPRDAFGRLLATAHLEDRGDAIAGPVLDRVLCNTGTREVIVDSCGTPLDLGREQRLYSGAQKVTLGVRDGGCLIPRCSMPPSYCESHHIDHWVDDHGSTDIDRGVLLCRFHHMALHNHGWKIAREGDGPFTLRMPDHPTPIVLRSKSPVAWAWNPPAPPGREGWRRPPVPDRPPAHATPGRREPPSTPLPGRARDHTGTGRARH